MSIKLQTKMPAFYKNYSSKFFHSQLISLKKNIRHFFGKFEEKKNFATKTKNGSQWGKTQKLYLENWTWPFVLFPYFFHENRLVFEQRYMFLKRIYMHYQGIL